MCLMGSLVLTMQWMPWETLSEWHWATTTNRPPINTKCVRPAASKPNLPTGSSHYSPRLSGGFFRSETAANFYSVRAWPWWRADGGPDCAVSEMDWFLVVMITAGNWQQSDGCWNSWPVTLKTYSPDHSQPVKMWTSRESLGLSSDIENIKNIIEETVDSIEVNGKWLSSIYGAIMSLVDKQVPTS